MRKNNKITIRLPEDDLKIMREEIDKDKKYKGNVSQFIRDIIKDYVSRPAQKPQVTEEDFLSLFLEVNKRLDDQRIYLNINNNDIFKQLGRLTNTIDKKANMTYRLAYMTMNLFVYVLRHKLYGDQMDEIKEKVIKSLGDQADKILEKIRLGVPVDREE